MKLGAIRENTILAFDTLRGHKVRTALTILGVFIGVFIIIAVAAVLNGFRETIVQQVERFGTSVIFIHRFPFVQTGDLSPEVRQRKPMSLEDAWAIRDRAPSVEYVSPGLQSFFLTTAKYQGQEMRNPRLRGVFPESEMVTSYQITEGRFFTDSENEHAAPVAVIGSHVIEALFPNISPIDKEFIVNGRKFRVIGGLEKNKGGFGGDNPEDSIILIPYRTFKKMAPWADDHMIFVKARAGRLDAAINEITDVLRLQRKVKYNEPNSFEIGTPDSLIEAFDQIVFAVLAVMVAISSVAFMVGGVGVMNIMLVSVTERTREIGIRKAIGARRSDIIWQFLTEAMALTGAGGILGILIGMLAAFLFNRFIPNLPAIIPMWAYIFGFAGSVSIGLIFGIWPAVKASKLDPIEALRYE
ncbi:MAG: ABC transporter permease [Acidobacteriota bacterium]